MNFWYKLYSIYLVLFTISTDLCSQLFYAVITTYSKVNLPNNLTGLIIKFH